jgi:DNA polymerase-3 subunit gamma/tau
LQLALDLFRDLQSSLQPRLHLEIGLLRMVHAGKLQPIEEALAGLRGAEPSKPQVAKPPVAKSAAIAAPAPVIAAPVTPPPVSPASGDLRSRIHAALVEAKKNFVADALEHAQLAESLSELVFTVPKMYAMYLKEPEFEATAKRIAGRPLRVTVKIGDAAPAAVAVQAPAPKQADEATTRALSHPEVKRFQEMFPDAHVRIVRNLKDN